jgi:hypothetical protein
VAGKEPKPQGAAEADRSMEKTADELRKEAKGLK